MGGGVVFCPGKRPRKGRARKDGARGAGIPLPPVFPVFPIGKTPEISRWLGFGIEGAQPCRGFPSPPSPRLYNSSSSREFNFLCKKRILRNLQENYFVFKSNHCHVCRVKERKKKTKTQKTCEPPPVYTQRSARLGAEKNSTDLF